MFDIESRSWEMNPGW